MKIPKKRYGTSLQTFKKRVKKYLIKILPPWLQLIIKNVMYPRHGYSQFKKHRMEEGESRRILRGLKNKEITKAVIVYDNLCSPPTYGDYFFVVMLARYFTSQDIAVSFIIVDGEYRSDWSALDEDEIKNLVAEYVYIANLLLDSRLATIEVLMSSQLQARVKDNINKSIDVPFRESVIKRKYIYGHVLNTLNRLCFESSRGHLDQFLLFFDELAGKVAFKKPEQPYITWNCRYSTKWDFERNAGEEEFLPIYARLKALYPQHAIMVVSDNAGCNYFKGIASQHGLNCLFSKDYSDTLMGDGALILGSDYFFMLRGGGIAVFPLFSRVPHERITYSGNEVAWRHERATSWAADNQIFRLPDRDENIWPTLAVVHEDNLHSPKLDRIEGFLCDR